MTLSDEILLKYADGHLDAKICRELEIVLDVDKEAAEKLRLLRLSSSRLKAEINRLEFGSKSSSVIGVGKDSLADMILSGTLTGTENGKYQNVSIASDIPKMRSKLPAFHNIAAAIALLSIGLVVGFYSKSIGPVPNTSLNGENTIASYPTWLIRVVDYHTLYGRATVAGSTATRADINDYQRHFSDTLGSPVLVPDLSAQKWNFRRGQVLSFNDDPIIQLAYLPEKKGRPIALCLKKDAGLDVSPHFARIRGLATMRWRTGGIEYVLVGDVSEKHIRTAAIGAATQINKGIVID